jgi:hypothetical protein
METGLEDVRDLTKLVTRKRHRCSNTEHLWKRKRGGVEKCELCGDRIPCKNDEHCWHIECWVRRLNMGLVKHYPISRVIRGLVITNGVRIVFDATADDPLDWTLPTKETRVEDVT